MAAIATRLRLPWYVQDAVLAAFVTLTQIRGTHLVAPSEQLANLDAVGYGLLTVSGVALLVRRRWPVPVFAVVAGISAGYYIAGYPDGPGWVGLFIALYSLTAHGEGERSVRIAAGGIAALTLVWLLTADLRPLIDAGWVFFRIGTAIMAAALGESVRSRMALAADAQRRAELAELAAHDEARRRVDAERLRIAREVHDTVAHAIAIINVQAGVTAHVLDKRPQRARETLLTIEQTSGRALRELRATLGMLRHTDTDTADDGLEPAPGLERLDELTAMAREAGLDVAVDVPATAPELPSTVDRAAYRILQESITNAVRHSGAARVAVELRYGPTELDIRVADDGRGVSDGGTGGQGIVGMTERAALLGGSLTAGPAPGGGFEVRARIPVEPVPAAQP